MDDVDRRAELTRYVYRHLADSRFRERLTAADADGNRPVLVALPEDRVRRVVLDVLAAGGAANVAVPLLNGFVTFAVTLRSHSEEPASGVRLAADCTIGLFLERARIDGEHAIYRFFIEGVNERTESGSAELVAVAG